MPLRPYGSKPKLRPFGGGSLPDPIKDIRVDIEHTLIELAQLTAEEVRLFKIVDKADLNGRRDRPKAEEARAEWQQVWRKIERNNAMLHHLCSKERSLRNGKL